MNMLIRNSTAAAILCLAFAGCSDQKPSYPATITPVYAATAGQGLYLIYGDTVQDHFTVSSTGPGGLASDKLRSIAVGGSGSSAYVYVGSDAGISRFNGVAWMNWGASKLGSADARAIFLGNGLSVATASGLAAYNADGAGTWTLDPRLAASGPTSIFKYGRFTFVGTSSDGLYVYSGTGEARHFTKAADGLASDSVKAVIGYSLEEIYVGTTEGLSELDPKAPSASTSKFSTIAGTAGSSVNGLCVDSHGILYAAADSGIYYHVTYDSASSAQYFAPSEEKMLCVAVDGAGTVYSGTDTGRLYILDGTGASYYKLGSPVVAIAATAPLYSF